MISESPIRVLVAEDDQALRSVLERFLGSRGYKVRSVPDGPSALSELRAQPYDIALVDFVMPGMDGLEVLRQIQNEPDPPEVVIMTGKGTMDTAITAVKLGAYDYIAKPYRLEEIEVVVKRAVEKRALSKDVERLQAMVGEGGGETDSYAIVTESEAGRAVAEDLARLARASGPVLVSGERGTGMKHFARALHAKSSPGRPFVTVNADEPTEFDVDSEIFGHEKGARPGIESRRPGGFERAAGGTLLIENVHAMPRGLQEKLVGAFGTGWFTRAGGNQPVTNQARVVMLTPRNIAVAVTEGRLSQELVDLCADSTVAIPPLRDRLEDLPALAGYFLQRFGGSRALSLSPEAFAALASYSWPGNISELRTMMERVAMVATGETVNAADLGIPGWGTTPPSGHSMSLADLERNHIERVLAEHRWHQGNAATALGISAKTLYRKIREYGFVRPKDAPPEE